MNFDVSQSAARRISELIKNEPDSKVAIRVAVDSGGCSGFMYDYNLIDKVNDDDFILWGLEMRGSYDDDLILAIPGLVIAS